MTSRVVFILSLSLLSATAHSAFRPLSETEARFERAFRDCTAAGTHNIRYKDENLYAANMKTMKWKCDGDVARELYEALEPLTAKHPLSVRTGENYTQRLMSSEGYGSSCYSRAGEFGCTISIRLGWIENSRE